MAVHDDGGSRTLSQGSRVGSGRSTALELCIWIRPREVWRERKDEPARRLKSRRSEPYNTGMALRDRRERLLPGGVPGYV